MYIKDGEDTEETEDKDGTEGKYDTQDIEYTRDTEDKLDGVGPVDNRPSTNQLHNFVHFLKKKKITFDT